MKHLKKEWERDEYKHHEQEEEYMYFFLWIP